MSGRHREEAHRASRTLLSLSATRLLFLAFVFFFFFIFLFLCSRVARARRTESLLRFPSLVYLVVFAINSRQFY